MFENSSTLALFPTFVWVHDLKAEDLEAVNQGILDRLAEMLPPDKKLPVGRSFQTRTNLQELPEFAALIRLALKAAEQALAFLEHEPRALTATGCWANVNAPGVHHPEHCHPNNYFSGVYYARAPEGANTISFHDPRPQAHMIAPPVKQVSPKHASTINVTTKVGRLVLFPSWLRHSVVVNNTQELRISVSFNLMFEGFTEAVSPPRF